MKANEKVQHIQNAQIKKSATKKITKKEIYGKSYPHQKMLQNGKK